ncbi:hypothetical protein CEXT_262661 [Caerostris extrusa]|uniref:Secreted protein n=1 Tax=Caerostris extrusa TaxID=172846 RepID=A0AAV4R4P6_CAEEX|nr:hypothetical protein CEXT_262661 [Caerostris extrusa]
MICQPCVRNQIRYPLLILVVTVTGATSNNIDAITHQCIEGAVVAFSRFVFAHFGEIFSRSSQSGEVSANQAKGIFCALNRKQT